MQRGVPRPSTSGLESARWPRRWSKARFSIMITTKLVMGDLEAAAVVAAARERRERTRLQREGRRKGYYVRVAIPRSLPAPAAV